MRYAQLVMGPAGSGKSTYCSNIVQHCGSKKRSVYVINLDPAAENFNYPVIADVRDLIQVDDVMDDNELHLGPNGGLIFCMEYLMNNIGWLEEKLGCVEDDYFLFDCPGQIELYTHIPVIRNFIHKLQEWDIRVCGVYLVDSQFMIDAAKFISGAMSALACMINLEIPHVNIMSKMDLISAEDKKNIDRYLTADPSLIDELDEFWGKKFHKLNTKISSLIEDYSLVRFLPLNLDDDESVSAILYHIDSAIQYDEDREFTGQEIDDGIQQETEGYANG